MIFKKIGNMENVEAICHYYLWHPRVEISSCSIDAALKNGFIGPKLAGRTISDFRIECY